MAYNRQPSTLSSEAESPTQTPGTTHWGIQQKGKKKRAGACWCRTRVGGARRKGKGRLRLRLFMKATCVWQKQKAIKKRERGLRTCYFIFCPSASIFSGILGRSGRGEFMSKTFHKKSEKHNSLWIPP
jgi:hypothetical protein